LTMPTSHLLTRRSPAASHLSAITRSCPPAHSAEVGSSSRSDLYAFLLNLARFGARAFSVQHPTDETSRVRQSHSYPVAKEPSGQHHLERFIRTPTLAHQAGQSLNQSGHQALSLSEAERKSVLTPKVLSTRFLPFLDPGPAADSHFGVNRGQPHSHPHGILFPER